MGEFGRLWLIVFGGNKNNPWNHSGVREKPNYTNILNALVHTWLHSYCIHLRVALITRSVITCHALMMNYCTRAMRASTLFLPITCSVYLAILSIKSFHFIKTCNVNNCHCLVIMTFVVFIILRTHY